LKNPLDTQINANDTDHQSRTTQRVATMSYEDARQTLFNVAHTLAASQP
jgi:hypothetical protein